MRLAVITLCGLLAFTAYAETPNWEYRVVFLPGTVADGTKPKITPDVSGAFIDDKKTEILNRLAAQGWEVISVTGDSGADHAIYLRRPLSAQPK